MIISLEDWLGFELSSLLAAKLRRGRRSLSISGLTPTLSKYNNAFLEVQQINVSIDR